MQAGAQPRLSSKEVPGRCPGLHQLFEVNAMKRFIGVAMFAAAVVAIAAVRTWAEEKPGALTADQAFEQLKVWDYGQSRRPLAMLELAIARASADPAQKGRMAERLSAIIADPQATEGAKLFACQQLPLVATDAQVPMLAKMLDDPKTAEMTRRALDCIPGQASIEALRSALARVKGAALVGIIDSLGARRDGPSVGAVARFLGDSDPQVAAAAAWALGKIGSADAGAALLTARAQRGTLIVLRDAMLSCADRLVADGDAKAAEAIYRRMMLDSSASVSLRLAVMSGLARANKEAALPLVIEALAADDPILQAGAVRLTRDLAGASVTAALVGQLEKLSPKGQALVIDALGDRGDKAAAGPVAKRLDDRDDAVRAAAAGAMAKLGDASSVDRLATLAAADKGAVQQAARLSLVRLAGADVDKRVLAAAAEGEPAVRAELFRAMAARRTAGASPLLLKAAADAAEPVRTAAFDALAVLGQADDYPKLIPLLVAAKGQSEAAEKAVLAVGGRLASVADRVGPAVAALGAAPAEAKPPILRLLGSFGGPEALKAVTACVKDSDAAIRDAAVRSLANWPDETAADDLLALVKGSDNATHRVLAMRGYLRLAGVAKDEAVRLKMLAAARPTATTADSRKMLLAGLADVPDPAALDMALSMVGDKEVQAEASAAVLKIARALVATNRAAVEAAMARTRESRDEAAAEKAAILARALQGPAAPGEEVKALLHDKARSDALKKDLAKRAPKGYRLACYLDCGPDTEDGAKGGPVLRAVGANTHLWPGAEAAGPLRFGTIAWGPQQVLFEAAGLAPKRAYQVGFSWWDFDHDTRAESVWMSGGKGGREVQALAKTKLPSGQSGPAQEKTLAVPRDLCADGTLRITFRNESTPNAVVSEIWLWESEAESAAPAEKAVAAPPAPVKPGQKRIVIVTGMEYPGHKWKETAPAMAEILRQDPRLAVTVVEDPQFLGSAELKNYDAIFLNYMNWEVPAPPSEARKNFQACVDGGAGLVLLHFACGAFQDWPEFRNIAGRVWDPKLRGHDPFGKFRVDVAKPDHPIMQGLTPFETTDELYTCLTGDKPIEVIATAKSKVDGKDYPMAFVLTYGKGRVFHCVLGHDVPSIKNPPVAELYRRGTAWAAGLAPAPEGK